MAELAPTTVLVAHAGAGATWQAMLVLLSFGLVAVFVLAVAGRVRVERPDDLLVPLAGTAVLGSLSGATSSFLSDWVGWWFPIGVTALVALVLAATTSLRLEPRSPLTIGAVVVAAAAAVALHATIEDAWHPVDGLRRDDVAITFTSPADGATVPIGPLDVTVAVTGGSVGPGPGDGPPADPEEGGQVRVYVDGRLVTDAAGAPAPPDQDCADGCTEVTWTVEVDRGPHVLSAEFLTADGRSFATTVAGSPTVALLTVTAE